MGKHIKTKMDYDMIDQLARELQRLDPENEVRSPSIPYEDVCGPPLN